MKITCEDGLSNSVRVIDDNGEDLLKSLTISSIKVIFEPDSFVRAILEIPKVEIDINLKEKLKRIEYYE